MFLILVLQRERIWVRLGFFASCCDMQHKQTHHHISMPKMAKRITNLIDKLTGFWMEEKYAFSLNMALQSVTVQFKQPNLCVSLCVCVSGGKALGND